MISTTVKGILCAALVTSLAACGDGSDGAGMSTSAAPVQPAAKSANMPVLVSDASSEDWATIGVKILGIALLPQGGGAAVTVYTAASPAPMINLAQLDQLGELLGNVNVPQGTYTGAILTIAANPGDVALIVAADPEAGFPVAAGTSIASNLIQIQGAHGAAASLTVPVKVTFDSALVVDASQDNALDLEFDLAHPAFIVGHTPPASGQTLWAVNFDGPVRRHEVADVRHLVLRHLYGSVTAVATDGTSITVTKDLPTLPVVSPETPVATSASLEVLADSTNGTLFYDVDAKTVTTIKDFSAASASLVGKYVRMAMRYQADGTLVAVRVWASSQFDDVWISPEGHVVHVDASGSKFYVTNESGEAVAVSVGAGTEFFFRQPQNAAADATPIGTGGTFLTNDELVRGFKVHVSVADPLATPLVAQSVDIETAAYDGRISGASSTGFTYVRSFRTSSDDYSVSLDYISSATANGSDASGNAIEGFKWWDFAFPTQLTSGSGAVAAFVAATDGGVNFGGTAGAVSAWGRSFAVWGDPASPGAWSVPLVTLMPTPVPLGVVASGFTGSAFAMSVAGGVNPATVDVATAAGSATLVYQVDRTNGIVTVSPIDVTTAAGIGSLTNGLTTGASVKVFGIPQPDGTLKAYVILYFTGQKPAS